MKLNLRHFICFVPALMVFSLQAQVQFSISASAKDIGRKDEIQVNYVLSGSANASNFIAPYFRNWTVIAGPDFSTETYNINGSTSKTITYSYLLSPINTGQLKLPATTIDVNNTPVWCKEVVINVRKQDHVDGVADPSYGIQPQQPYSTDVFNGETSFKEYVLKPGEDPHKKIKQNLFIKVIPGKTKCYVGEPVLVEYKLYTRLKSNSRVLKQPGFTGCRVSEMTTNDITPEVENINGKKFKTYLFRKVQLFALQPGKMILGQAAVGNTVTFTTATGDLKKLYYDNEPTQDVEVTLYTDPVSIEVLPLPIKDRSAAIGRFYIDTKLKKDTMAANESNTLVVTVSGNGNFASVTEPQINWPDNMYHFDGVESEELDKLSFPVSGKKIFEIPFEAGETGVVEVPAVYFSYFDPATAKYKTLQTQPLPLIVTPARKASIQQTVATAETGAGNIRLLYYLLPAVFIIGAVIIRKKTKQQGKRVIPVVAAPSPTLAAGKDFDAAEKLNDLFLLQDDAAFYSHAGMFAKDLIQRGIGDNDILLQVLQDCNTVLYSPIPCTSKKEVLEKLQRAIS